MNNPLKDNIVPDKLAIGLSGLCLIHCLLLPIIIIFLPFLGTINEYHFHLEILLIIFPISIIALWLGYKSHKKIEIIYFAIFGLLLLTIGGTIIHSLHGEKIDTIVTIIGSLTLGYSHYKNYILQKH